MVLHKSVPAQTLHTGARSLETLSSIIINRAIALSIARSEFVSSQTLGTEAQSLKTLSFVTINRAAALSMVVSTFLSE